MPPHDPVSERRAFSVIGAFYEVYNTLGFGLLEQLYMAALEIELIARGHVVQREVSVAVTYKGTPIGVQRMDMLVDGCFVVEGKSSVTLPPSAIQQLHTYLVASGLADGLLLHFGPEAQFRRATRRR